MTDCNSGDIGRVALDCSSGDIGRVVLGCSSDDIGRVALGCSSDDIRRVALGCNNGDTGRVAMDCNIGDAPWGIGAFILAAALLINATAAQDSRCYLSDSSSTANFFAREDLPVGSLLGVLGVMGDPRDTGDITLSLDRRDYPVSIESGSGNITLTRTLDREGRDGPSSVAVNVICDRKGTTDPSIIIPVNIRVQDVNDNAPRFIGDPYTLNISEVTVPGTVVLQGIKATDADQQGRFSTVHYSILEGNFAEYIDFANGLDGTLRLKQQLDYEDVQQFRLTLRAQDNGEPPLYTEAYLTVNVIDADDQNPKFRDDKYVIILPPSPVQGQLLSVRPRPVMAFDQDIGIDVPVRYEFTSDGADTGYFYIEPASGVVSVRENIPSNELVQPITLVVKAIQVDNTDRYALTTLTISRDLVSSDRLQFVQGNYVASVLENRPVDSVILTLITNRPGDKRVKFSLLEELSAFRISSSGELVLRTALDYELRDKYNFSVSVTDGRQSDSATVTIIVLNVNDWDPRFRYPSFDFVAAAHWKPGTVVGRLTVYDGDRGDRISVGLMGPDALAFSVTTDGDLVISDTSRLNSSVAHLVAVARDSGVPPRRSSVPITVRFPQEQLGANVEAESSVLLMIIFGVLLGVLILVIFTLGLYICKYKKDRARNRRTSPALGVKVASYVGSDVPHEKLTGAGSELEVPPSAVHHQNVSNSDHSHIERMPFSVADTPVTTVRASQRFSRHLVNGSMRNPLANGSSLGSQTSLSGAPASPLRQTSQQPLQRLAGSPGGARGSQRSLDSNGSASYDGADGSASYNGAITFRPAGPAPVWPDGSIPKRVKKLSWEDEQNRTELDPDVSVTPLPNMCIPDVDVTSCASTVYF